MQTDSRDIVAERAAVACKANRWAVVEYCRTVRQVLRQAARLLSAERVIVLDRACSAVRRLIGDAEVM